MTTDTRMYVEGLRAAVEEAAEGTSDLYRALTEPRGLTLSIRSRPVLDEPRAE